ncbi:hypothetical protein [Leptolyngbya sp. FACHB-261]|uniref:hypothetical protein n=1 Tax=Leptolyngbya sp. FACHB-261 TaxID=2692806 RepID=UPI0016896FAA|nr:hypothetical protein [Leptolyngbya sp. FACHB-261]MBD2101424.1 hypothetical protein [Leptolyngbya sp. FACHB-261]
MNDQKTSSCQTSSASQLSVRSSVSIAYDLNSYNLRKVDTGAMQYINFVQILELARQAGLLYSEDISWLQEYCSGWIVPMLEEEDLSNVRALETHVQAVQQLLKQIHSKRQDLLQPAWTSPNMLPHEVAQVEQEHFINIWLKLPQLEGLQRVLESLLHQGMIQLDQVWQQQMVAR